MLPFLKKKQEASVVTPVEVQKREPDSEPAYDSLHSASEELMHAVHSKDIASIASALRAAFQICDSEPHEEGLES